MGRTFSLASCLASFMRLFGMTLIMSALCSCASPGGLYAPRTAFPIDTDITELKAQFGPIASIKGYYSAAETPDRRNEFIAGRLVFIDLEYIRFISNFRLSRAESATAFDAASLGIGFATTITAGERAKTILGAVTTALVGARTSYEKNFYEDKTSDALVAQMSAQRKQALVAIIAGSKGSLAQYNLTQAVADLATYARAGTLDGALEGIQSDASQKQQEAKVALDRLRSVTYGPDDNSTRILKWLYPTAASIKDLIGIDSNGQPVSLSTSNGAALQDELTTKLQLDVPILTILVDPGSATTRQTVIKDLKIP